MAKKKGVLGWMDFFLALIILLNLFDFFELPFFGGELDYLKKIISWTMLGYLLFKASPSKVFYGERSEDADVVIIVAYFLLVVKNLVSYASVASRDGLTSMFRAFYQYLVVNYAQFELWTFLAGILILLIFGLYVTLRVDFHKRSVMGVLHEDGPPGRYVERYFMTVLVLFGFFLLVFNMMMEWLAIAVDSTLLLVALLFYSVVVIRRKVSLHRYLDRVGNVGYEFYRWFIDHFRYKETFMLGIVGLLVLHLLTDIGNFLVPYLTGVNDAIYFGMLPARASAWSVLAADWSLSSSFLYHSSLLVVFVANVVAFIVLFVSPAVIWYHLYHRRHPRIPGWLSVGFFSSVPVVVLSPLFVVGRLEDSSFLVGVDVTTRHLAGPIPLSAVAGLVLVLFAGLLWWHHHDRGLKSLQRWWVASSLVFFAFYTWNYFTDVAAHYVDVVSGLAGAGRWFLALVFFFFMVIVFIFYAGGFLVLLYELGHRVVHEKKTI